MRMALRKPDGFSLVELVVVIVLLGIVGVVVISRFITPSSFNDVAARDGLAAGIRAAQQAALGRTGVTFEIDSSADSWFFVVKEGANTIRTFEIGNRDLVLETGSAAALSGLTCATGYDTALDNFTLSFNSRGNLTNFSNGAINENVDNTFNGVRICVNDTNALSVCVSRAGYASVGNCDD